MAHHGEVPGQITMRPAKAVSAMRPYAPAHFQKTKIENWAPPRVPKSSV